MPDIEINRRIILSSRPVGAPTKTNFQLQQSPIPEPASGELLLRNIYLSLDPYMRGRMSDAPSYAPPIPVGQVMEGGTIAYVEKSTLPDFHVGELVLGFGGWQDFWISNGEGLTKIATDFEQPSRALGILGMPGFTAYMGLLDIGQPQAGETLVVAAASGAVGSIVGQIGKIMGCRTVGIAGGASKCRYVTDELGFDACIDRHTVDMAKDLAAACPKGIDIYFESVGGAVFDAVLPLLNTKARIPLCGLISHYNDDELPVGRDRVSLLMKNILTKRLKIQGFIIFADYADRFGEFTKQMSEWVTAKRIVFREDIVNGLENAPSKFIGMLTGENFGKVVIRL